jgi:dTDP-4-amino-4,6-dideoxygalactose transaminase
MNVFQPQVMSVPFLRAAFPNGLEEVLAEVLNSGYVGSGDLVISFENAIQKLLGAVSVTATSSCTAALTLAYHSAGIKKGSVILATPMTCAATNIPLLQLGAKIEWLDIDPMSGNVSQSTVTEGLARHPDAQAVVIMDWGGVPCDYAGIVAECERLEKPIILDAAQSFGSLHDGKPYPHQVDYVCYSFGPTKLFSTVEGGAVVTRDQRASAKMKALRWYGIRRESRDELRFWEYEVEELGYRFVYNNLFAAIGLRMLPNLRNRVKHHRDIAHAYDNHLSGISGLEIGRRLAESEPNFWLYTILVDHRETLLAKLHSHGIHAATPHRRNDRLLGSWNDKTQKYELRGVDKFDKEYLCLPIGPWIGQNDVARICGLIQSGW